jgi:hypothetical protein
MKRKGTRKVKERIDEQKRLEASRLDLDSI